MDTAAFAAECVAQKISRTMAQFLAERDHGATHDELIAIRNEMRSLLGVKPRRPNAAQRRATRRIIGAVIETAEEGQAIAEALAACDAALIAAGATLDAVSESGSRYYTLRGTKIRVSDHEANAATDNWIVSLAAVSIRVDLRGWENSLEDVIEG